ncbi:hypothetical protein SAMN02799631_03785, partial [Methylobacterium sp. 174MFSha1.1]
MAQPDPTSVETLGLSDLRVLVGTLIEQTQRLTAENRALRDEIARLKGLPPRPPTRQTPSGMEKATGAAKIPG